MNFVNRIGDHGHILVANEPLLSRSLMDRIAGQGVTPPEPIDQKAFDRVLGSLRPKLHRYCARMVGSGIDGEDVVQEALVKPIEAFPGATTIGNVEA
jgi:hypothetical protein